MPTLQMVNAVMSNVTLPMLMNYIETTFPQMLIIKIECIAKSTYAFSLSSQADMIISNGGVVN